MNKILVALGSIAFTFSLTALAQASGESELLGLGTGAVVGGVIGNQFGHGAGRVATTTAGVFVGGYIGDEVGRRLDEPDISGGSGYASYAAPSAFNYQPYYAPNYVAPSAPEPSAIYMNNASGVCREVPLMAPSGNGAPENYGVACLQPDGSWRVIP